MKYKFITEQYEILKGEDFRLLQEPAASEWMRKFLQKYTAQEKRADFIWSKMHGQWPKIPYKSVNVEEWKTHVSEIEKLLAGEVEHFIIAEYIHPSLIVSSRNIGKTIKLIDEAVLDDFCISHPEMQWMAAFSHHDWMYLTGSKNN